MTDVTALLAGIKERAEKATPGSWEIKEDCRDYPSVWHDQEVAFSIGRCADCGVEAEYEAEDAAFIAAARTDVPRLVAALEAVEDLAKRLRDNRPGDPDSAFDRGYAMGRRAAGDLVSNIIAAALGGGE